MRKHLALAGAALVLLAGCGGDGGASEDLVYRVSVTIEKVPPRVEREAPGLADFEQVEWLWPSRGAFRVEREGPVEPGSDERQREATVCTRAACMRLASYRERPSVRIGSPKFIRRWRDDSFALETLQRHLSGGGTVQPGFRLVTKRGGAEFHIVVEERRPAAEAEDGEVFAIADGPEVDLDRELAVGEPPTLVQAYWFGETIQGRKAVEAFEHRLWTQPPGLLRPGRPDVTETMHFTAYEDGLKVVSQPVAEPHTQWTLTVFDGVELTGVTYPRLRRTTIRLGNGDEATLFFTDYQETKGFSVLTESTLVSVHGFRSEPKDSIALARELRPL